MEANTLFKIIMRGKQKQFYAYYRLRVNAIWQPEYPLLGKTSEVYQTNTLLKQPLLISPNCTAISFKFYDQTNLNIFWEFNNFLETKIEGGVLKKIILKPTMNTTNTGKMAFIGIYNSFEGVEQHLEAYFIGTQVGVIHEVDQVSEITFEIKPKIYRIINFEQEKEYIKQNNIPFLGYK